MATKYTKEILEPIVATSYSYAEVARKLGISPVGSNTTNLKNRCRHHKIDVTHFTGQGHQRNKISHKRLKPEDVFVVFSSDKIRRQGFILTRALLESGVEYICDICKCEPYWNSKPLRLQVDHIDGQYWNNLKENLRFLCPNCHTQTDNWGSKIMG